MSLDHYNFDSFTETFIGNYQKMTETEMYGSKEFKSVIMYAKNQNVILRDASFIGAGKRPRNLGYEYKLFFLSAKSKVVEIEIYYESFTQKTKQLSISELDFETRFVPITPEGEKVSKIMSAASAKSNVALVEG